MRDTKLIPRLEVQTACTHFWNNDLIPENAIILFTILSVPARYCLYSLSEEELCFISKHFDIVYLVDSKSTLTNLEFFHKFEVLSTEEYSEHFYFKGTKEKILEYKLKFN